MNGDIQNTATSSEVAAAQIASTIAFLIFIIVLVLAARSIMRLGRKTSKGSFVELEKDYRWRRLKTVYCVLSVVSLFIVALASYGPAAGYLYEVDRAEARLSTIIALLITVVAIWSVYRFLMPYLYKKFLSIKNYVSKR